MNEPLNLTEIGIRYLSKCLLPIVANENAYIPELSCLSQRLGNLLLKTIIKFRRTHLSETTDCFLSLFNNAGQNKTIKSEVLIQLSELYLSCCPFITNQSMSKHLLSHELIEIIDLRDCNITYEIFQLITKYFPRLTTLYLGQTESKMDGKINLVDFFPPNSIDKECFLKKPKLKYLSLEGIHNTMRNDSVEEIFYHTLIQSSEQIRYVDLSRNSAIENLIYVDCFKQIHSLVLYDILPSVIESSIDSICCLKTLSLLDLSFNRRIQEPQNYSKPTITLAKLITSLPKLTSLDISGTNLAGSFSFDQDEELNYIKKELSIDENENFTMQASIAGLLVLKHKLDFLGLFDVDERGSARRWLPAKKITGEHTEEMIITSLSYYMERPSMVTHIMAHLFRLYNHYTIQNPFDAGKLVMDCMAKHLYDRSLQTSGSACLYYVVDLFQNESDVMLEKYNDYLKRLLVAILNAMSAHLQHSPMIRNGLLTISRMQMHVPNHIVSNDDVIKRSQQNDIEIPYNCGGILANILSDGVEAWTISSSIEQYIVNQEIYDATQTWDLHKSRTINYRSLAPILRLLNENFPTGCIMWAVWAMTNLTTVLPEKYCTLVRSENGEILLSQIAYSDKMSEPIKNLAQSALANIHRFHDAPVPMDIVPNDGVEI
ncbi:unnamed protein product [Rotaria socialis]|uniref:Uncharacterized protein n=1 Tax=Rotaria socialis TaxID=392032 RepID=A0A820RNY1_9BILA|nr:unnamed protein product [Rotaria socialis]